MMPQFRSISTRRSLAAPLAVVPAGRFSLLGDPVCLRDPRGKGPRPSLAPCATGAGVEVRGPFTILQAFSVTPQEGRAFVETSGDTNPIHVEDSIIPGAMTAARFLLVPEILIPGLAVRWLRVKFRAFSRYDRPLVNVYGVTPAEGGALSIAVRSYQQGSLVADATLSGSLDAAVPADPGTRGASWLRSAPGVSGEVGASVGVIHDFLHSVRVDPHGFLASLGFGYPRAFLASLPPGAMVRMGGAGGLLNALDLEFPDATVPHLETDPLPTAEVEAGRPRLSFRKILARVGTGIKTYCYGSATVLSAVVGPSSRRTARETSLSPVS